MVDHTLAHAYIAALSCTKEGAELVQALEAVRYYHSEGLVLLPGEKDKLTYQSADWLDNTIRGALFWKDYHSYPVVIPYVLAEWAVQCIVEHSEWVPAPTWCTKPVFNSVDTMPGMYVLVPWGLKLPGLTPDKYAKRKATQSHYTQWSWDAPEMPGYSEDCPIVYNKTAEDVVHAARCAVGDSYYDYNPTTEKLMSPHHWPHIPEDEARAACQFLSDYKAWAYFDSCSYEQLIRHLQKRIFKGVDV